jgi:hypothetical protein
MRNRTVSYSSAALLIFASGAAAASVWFVPRQPSPQQISSNANVKVASPGSEEYFQMTEDERKLGIRHYVRPRSDYAGIFGRLSEFVDLKGKSKKNRFYISKVEVEDDTHSYVYVYWKEDNSILILYPPFDKEDSTYYEWVYSMRRIDLAKDVVLTEKEVGTTNYLVPKAEAQRMIRKCLASRIQITIQKPR